MKKMFFGLTLAVLLLSGSARADGVCEDLVAKGLDTLKRFDFDQSKTFSRIETENAFENDGDQFFRLYLRATTKRTDYVNRNLLTFYIRSGSTDVKFTESRFIKWLLKTPAAKNYDRSELQATNALYALFVECDSFRENR